ncbi:hypothetical protein HV819_09400 [Anaerococcus sp. AGMB00486]|uniref:Lipoprotein n=1 Tax=Anaerococcus faecalis TaxID=2742993 RepID=A0ABX2NBU7_9FIRM|nr:MULTISPECIES: hypothetical protein [Anaerococcus]MDY3005813.1 hypothetical protein [Anaerococcus porci]NVF12169.1 hypothetical protein [Anaerococcus faecalis]
MRKKLLTILFLGLVLSSCKGNKNKIDNDSSIEVKNDISSKKDIKDRLKTDKKDINDRLVSNKDEKQDKKVKSDIKRNGQYQDIYDRLKGVKFNIKGGSMVEALYFYRDGYFDGVEKGGNGGHVSIALYNGKFDITKKLSDTSYNLTLQRLDSDINVGEEKNIKINGYDNTFHYTDSIAMPKEDVGSDYTLYLPETKYSDLSEDAISFIKMMRRENSETKFDSNEKIGVFLIGHKLNDKPGSTYFLEFEK